MGGNVGEKKEGREKGDMDEWRHSENGWKKMEEMTVGYATGRQETITQ